MWDAHPDIDAALATLDLEPGATLAQAKAAFRKKAHELHPDKTAPTPETLAQLAASVKAIRLLESQVATIVDLAVSAHEAEFGATRTLTANGRTLMVRIPAGISQGTLVRAVGHTAIRVRISIDGPMDMAEMQPDGSGLDRFIDAFVKATPASRFAGWLRKARSAA